jgi:N-dimethylarginine dimethylaminohydrolase/TusA-related sulfurtransferase
VIGEIELDARGLSCPLPVLKARKRLAAMEPGQILTLLATDTMAEIDVPHFCGEAGHTLLESRHEDGCRTFRIERKRGPMFNEYGALKKVAVRAPEAAFVNDARLEAEWRPLNYHAKPSLPEACGEHRCLRELMQGVGAEVIELGSADGLTLDSLYVRDSLIVSPKGLIKCHMGKPARRAEPEVNAQSLGLPIAGEIAAPGKIEGGDLVWLDEATLLVGLGYRTNQEAVTQLRDLLPGADVLAFDLPHYKGRRDVFHLMSVLSPVDRDLAVVYLPLMPARLVECLEARNIDFVEVPDLEFPAMGCNVLALAPRHAVMVDGNPETARRLQAAGCKVEIIKADEISRKGEGGPTCLTRPLLRG